MHNPQTLTIETINADWCDKDMVMLHACFQLLTDFIGKELISEIIDWEYEDTVRNARKEMDELYKWWKARVDRETDGKLKPIYDEFQYEEDNDMLIRL
jgi:hypothetical protein